MRDLWVLLALAAACGRAEPPPELRFDVWPEPVADDVSAFVGGSSLGEVRATIMDATSTAEIVPTFLGREGWETVVVIPAGDEREDTVERGRTYVRKGGALRLDVRAGAGDRGAFMGGVVETGAERAMVQVKLEDRETLGARFRIRVHRVRARGRPEDVTPPYLQQVVPRGTYRAWVDVPSEGARFVVEVETTKPDGAIVARAWASPIGVERPWLTR
ncbi:MAG: hypothetical protein H6721_21480 [Sandaracinus sp.]|nr:hypothetical protein [Myxococcales bacterium]MCB9603446.1 hypothetical protein [Sandaracinus sp.]MCB9611927.1 hypothetical protein [Sandaracinus sp.]MCB9634707.1 hypothetical protein [Sandaracinus sp.]